MSSKEKAYIDTRSATFAVAERPRLVERPRAKRPGCRFHAPHQLTVLVFPVRCALGLNRGSAVGLPNLPTHGLTRLRSYCLFHIYHDRLASMHPSLQQADHHLLGPLRSVIQHTGSGGNPVLKFSGGLMYPSLIQYRFGNFELSQFNFLTMLAHSW